jgi:hypothetical protein
MWEKRIPFGTYNVTNPGFIITRQVLELAARKLKLTQKFEYWENDEAFYREGAKTPRSNCVMDVTKLLKAGIRIRPVNEAVEDALEQWVKQTG